MKVGFIGLGRMGGNLVENLMEDGHEFVVYNRTKETTEDFAKKHEAVSPAYNFEELISQLPEKKIVWLMIKSGKPVDDTISELLPHLSKGDIIIDGGNSYFKDSQRRGKELTEKGIKFLDVGTSGGMSGARNGACMMIGGEKEVFESVEDLFRDSCVKDGYGYMGSSGAGHFVKMVHNGIEYGMMAAIAEGFNAVKEHSDEFGTDLDTVAKVYGHGSIIESSLVSWTAEGMKRDYFSEISGEVPKGETESEMEELTKLSSMPVLETSISERQKTRGNPSYAGKLVSVMRNEFGGHKFKQDEK